MAKKVFITFLTILVISTFLYPIHTVRAAGLTTQIITDSEDFLGVGKDSDEVIDGVKIQDISGDIYNVLLLLGIGIAVIIGAILGIQFITGSVEQKGKVKEALIPFVVGCIVIFGAFTIWKLVILLLRR